MKKIVTGGFLLISGLLSLFVTNIRGGAFKIEGHEFFIFIGVVSFVIGITLLIIGNLKSEK